MDTENQNFDHKIPSRAKKVFSGVIFDVYQWEETAYDGKPMTFERLLRPDTALIIAVNNEKNIILTKEEQPARPGSFISLPGGRVNPGEDALSAAKRELLEETGFASDDWEFLSAVQPASKIEWTVHTFIARNCKKTREQSLDAGEKIEILPVHFEKFVEMMTSKDCHEQDFKILLLEAKCDPKKMAELKAKLGL